MKKIVLLRHGQSEPEIAQQGDFNRNLVPNAAKGIEKNCFFISKDLQWAPSEIFCSSAIRTVQTLEVLQHVLVNNCKTTITKLLYESSLEKCLDVFSDADDASECLLLIGHNPTWSSLVAYWSGEYRAVRPGEVVRLESGSSKPWLELLFSSGWTVVDS